MAELFEVGDYVYFKPDGEEHSIHSHVLALVLDKCNYVEPRVVIEYAIVDGNSIVYWVSANEVQHA